MTINPEVERLIRRFDLQAHPEGGHYTETYRSAVQVARQDERVVHSASTAIYYLLSAGVYSTWHRIASDEMWHFYKGCVVLIHVIDKAGMLHTHRLGDALQTEDASFQVMVPAGCWFAAELADPHGYALAGCTVAPGFEFSEFELADTAKLSHRHPEHAALIERLGART
ncbi:cupin domain-containing protein [Pollutimonas harenae]|uniref:Cupin domain-containing protein n=1 Tax=Pollutimonas harenae TaxID=657015 RepID=A0A853H424_9BURK|nr:cupin domain-containing protein [Pollutimonas harenae]NYT85945.1 cupin domain-containing protein [Pollutimonas harenae]TEA70995.1 cupin domain-containing protein [Pollutimonas harenae]